MVSFNRVILAGNLTKDPELRFTNDGVAVCDFGLAVNRVRSKDKDAADFFDVSAWRELAETVANYKKKGDPVLVEGRLTYSSWEAEDGSKRSRVTVTARNIQFLYGANGGPGGGSGEDPASGPGRRREEVEVPDEDWETSPSERRPGALS
jgi:single-strand DNA-binding protein